MRDARRLLGSAVIKQDTLGAINPWLCGYMAAPSNAYRGEFNFNHSNLLTALATPSIDLVHSFELLKMVAYLFIVRKLSPSTQESNNHVLGS